MAAEQRKLLEQLMGKEALGGIPDNVNFRDPEVCRDYLCGLCPHDLFTNTKVDLGPCPKKHMEKLKKEYEEAVSKRDHHGFEDDWTRSLSDFCADCDRKIEHARKRLEKTPEDAKVAQMVRVCLQLHCSTLFSEKMKEVDDLTNEISVLTALVEKLGEEGNVDESLETMRQADQLKETKEEKEKELKSLIGSENSQHQKLRVCGICSAYLSVFDSDRRLADHFQGKMHLGFKAVRDKLEELQKKALARGEQAIPIGIFVTEIGVEMIGLVEIETGTEILETVDKEITTEEAATRIMIGGETMIGDARALLHGIVTELP
ncbi:hypothetical protein BC829DRAFT_368751 [Chytridium lagenaria]|nr:hypothetical protein BC829DRAFT_368751 [Chytridium lagenaria]